jgi:hypothetical protein
MRCFSFERRGSDSRRWSDRAKKRTGQKTNGPKKRPDPKAKISGEYPMPGCSFDANAKSAEMGGMLMARRPQSRRVRRAFSLKASEDRFGKEKWHAAFLGFKT